MNEAFCRVVYGPLYLYRDPKQRKRGETELSHLKITRNNIIITIFYPSIHLSIYPS